MNFRKGSVPGNASIVMMYFFRTALCRGILFWLGFCLTAHAAAVRVAIVDTGPRSDFEPLLLAELSKAEGVELVERADIDKVLREHSLPAGGNLEAQLSMASLLHADGLLILDRVTLKEGDVLNVRLTASAPGVVIGSGIFAIRKDAPATLAQDIASRFKPFWSKLAVQREQAIPISLLNLRCPAKSAAAEKLERQLTFLFANRLVAQPELFVLERWRLADASFEKAFAHLDEGAFWNGGYIVDGEIQTSGTDPCVVSVKVFARPPNGGEAKVIEAAGDSGKLPELASELAGRLARVFAKQPPEAAWEPLEESREYLREADWACRTNQFTVARWALEASAALGNRDPNWFRFGARIYSNLAYWVDSGGTGIARTVHDKEADVSREPERVRCAQLAIDSLRGLLACRESGNANRNEYVPWWETMKDKPGYLGNTVLLAASLVLRNGFEHGLAKDPSLAEIRAGIRELFPKLASLREPNLLEARSPDVVAASYYPYWYETLAGQAAACRALLRHEPLGNKESSAAAVRSILLRCSYLLTSTSISARTALGDVVDAPRLVGWNDETPDNLDAVWRDLIASLMASPEAAERLDGLLLQIANAKTGKEAMVRHALEQLWEARAEIVAMNRAGALVANLGSYLKENAKSLDFDATQIFDHAYCVKWLCYFLENSSKGDLNLIWWLWNWTPGQFTSQEANAVYRAWLGYHNRLTKAKVFMNRRYGDFESALLKRFPELTPPEPPACLRVSRFFPIPELIAAKTSNATVELARSEDKLWAFVLTPDGKDYHGAIYEMDAGDFAIRERIALPQSMKFSGNSQDSDRFAVSAAAIYHLSGANVFRYDRKNRAWSIIPLPDGKGAGWRSLLPVGEDFFVGLSANSNPDRISGIWKWNAATKEFLMISCNRRRPAQNKLDDCEGYSDVHLFLGPEQKLGVCENHNALVYDAQAGRWEPLDGAAGFLVYRAAASDYSLLSASKGTLGLIRQPGGKAVEWCRGETPHSAPEAGGVLPSAYSHALKRGDRATKSLAYCNGKVWYCEPSDLSPTRFHTLRCIDWANPDLPARGIPMAFEMPEAAKRFLSGSMPNPMRKAFIPEQLCLAATKNGVIFWTPHLPGFWFVSTEEAEKAQQQ